MFNISFGAKIRLSSQFAEICRLKECIEYLTIVNSASLNLTKARSVVVVIVVRYLRFRVTRFEIFT